MAQQRWRRNQTWAVVTSDAGDEGTPVGLLLTLTFPNPDLDAFDKLYVGVAGDVVFQNLGGVSITLTNAGVGWHLVKGRRVLATGTLATNMVAARNN